LPFSKSIKIVFRVINSTFFHIVAITRWSKLSNKWTWY